MIRERTREERAHVTDHLRALTLTIDASGSLVNVERPVSLCPGARVYALDMGTTCEASNGAELRLQDSVLGIPPGESYVLDYDFPGLRWPAHAKLVAYPGSIVTLHVLYGNCGGNDS